MSRFSRDPSRGGSTLFGGSDGSGSDTVTPPPKQLTKKEKREQKKKQPAPSTSTDVPPAALPAVPAVRRFQDTRFYEYGLCWRAILEVDGKQTTNNTKLPDHDTLNQILHQARCSTEVWVSYTISPDLMFDRPVFHIQNASNYLVGNNQISVAGFLHLLRVNGGTVGGEISLSSLKVHLNHLKASDLSLTLPVNTEVNVFRSFREIWRNFALQKFAKLLVLSNDRKNYNNDQNALFCSYCDACYNYNYVAETYNTNRRTCSTNENNHKSICPWFMVYQKFVDIGFSCNKPICSECNVEYKLYTQSMNLTRCGTVYDDKDILVEVCLKSEKYQEMQEAYNQRISIKGQFLESSKKNMAPILESFKLPFIKNKLIPSLVEFEDHVHASLDHLHEGNDKTMSYYMTHGVKSYDDQMTWLVAPCGMGKTTRVPGLMMENGNYHKLILVTERRSAVISTMAYYRKNDNYKSLGITTVFSQQDNQYDSINIDLPNKKSETYLQDCKKARHTAQFVITTIGMLRNDENYIANLLVDPKVLLIWDEAHNTNMNFVSLLSSILGNSQRQCTINFMTATPPFDDESQDLSTPFAKQTSFVKLDYNDMVPRTKLTENMMKLKFSGVDTFKNKNENWLCIVASTNDVEKYATMIRKEFDIKTIKCFSGSPISSKIIHDITFSSKGNFIVSTDYLQESVTLDINRVIDFGQRIRPVQNATYFSKLTLQNTDTFSIHKSITQSFQVPFSIQSLIQTCCRVGRLARKPEEGADRAFVFIDGETPTLELGQFELEAKDYDILNKHSIPYNKMQQYTSKQLAITIMEQALRNDATKAQTDPLNKSNYVKNLLAACRSYPGYAFDRDYDLTSVITNLLAKTKVRGNNSKPLYNESNNSQSTLNTVISDENEKRSPDTLGHMNGKSFLITKVPNEQCVDGNTPVYCQINRKMWGRIEDNFNERPIKPTFMKLDNHAFRQTPEVFINIHLRSFNGDNRLRSLRAGALTMVNLKNGHNRNMGKPVMFLMKKNGFTRYFLNNNDCLDYFMARRILKPVKQGFYYGSFHAAMDAPILKQEQDKPPPPKPMVDKVTRTANFFKHIFKNMSAYTKMASDIVTEKRTVFKTKKTTTQHDPSQCNICARCDDAPLHSIPFVSFVHEMEKPKISGPKDFIKRAFRTDAILQRKRKQNKAPVITGKPVYKKPDYGIKFIHLKGDRPVRNVFQYEGHDHKNLNSPKPQRIMITKTKKTSNLDKLATFLKTPQRLAKSQVRPINISLSINELKTPIKDLIEKEKANKKYTAYDLLDITPKMEQGTCFDVIDRKLMSGSLKITQDVFIWYDPTFPTNPENHVSVSSGYKNDNKFLMSSRVNVEEFYTKWIHEYSFHASRFNTGRDLIIDAGNVAERLSNLQMLTEDEADRIADRFEKIIVEAWNKQYPNIGGAHTNISEDEYQWCLSVVLATVADQGGSDGEQYRQTFTVDLDYDGQSDEVKMTVQQFVQEIKTVATTVRRFERYYANTIYHLAITAPTSIIWRWGQTHGITTPGIGFSSWDWIDGIIISSRDRNILKVATRHALINQTRMVYDNPAGNPEGAWHPQPTEASRFQTMLERPGLGRNQQT